MDDELTEDEEEQALILAIEEGSKEGRATAEEHAEFTAWLQSL